MARQLALLLQLFGCFDGVVGENAIGAGAFEGEQAFKDDFVTVQPAVLDRSLEHGVFAGRIGLSRGG